MGNFWYFAMQIFGPKKTTKPAELTSNLFNKGDRLVIFDAPFVMVKLLSCILCHTNDVFVYFDLENIIDAEMLSS